jgi:predicted MFS family arabinose efflux permease
VSAATPHAPTGGGPAGVALVATLAIQIYIALTATTVAVLAPELARDFGIEPRWVGVFVSLIYVGAMPASLVCGGFIRSAGAIRVSQVCIVLCATGIGIVAAVPSTAVGLAALAAVVMGFGYGPITPASSHVLARTTPASRLSLVFSIKQTGVPAGAALAGAVLPGLALAFGWRGAIAGVAALGVLVIVLAERVRPALDADRQPATPITLAGMLAPLRMIFGQRSLSDLVLVSCAFAAVQSSLCAYLVVYLTEALHWTLVAAGLALTATTVGGIVGRIAWGAVADRTRRSRQVLVTIGLLAGICSVTLGLARPGWPVAAVVMLVAAFGATAIGWNGVQLAEIARQAPAGQAGAVTGAAGLIMFSGVVVGPLLFAAVSVATGGYHGAFVVLAAASFGGSMVLLLRGRRPAA